MTSNKQFCPDCGFTINPIGHAARCRPQVNDNSQSLRMTQAAFLGDTFLRSFLYHLHLQFTEPQLFPTPHHPLLLNTPRALYQQPTLTLAAFVSRYGSNRFAQAVLLRPLPYIVGILVDIQQQFDSGFPFSQDAPLLLVEELPPLGPLLAQVHSFGTLFEVGLGNPQFRNYHFQDLLAFGFDYPTYLDHTRNQLLLTLQRWKASPAFSSLRSWNASPRAPLPLFRLPPPLPPQPTPPPTVSDDDTLGFVGTENTEECRVVSFPLAPVPSSNPGWYALNTLPQLTAIAQMFSKATIRSAEVRFRRNVASTDDYPITITAAFWPDHLPLPATPSDMFVYPGTYHHTLTQQYQNPPPLKCEFQAGISRNIKPPSFFAAHPGRIIAVTNGGGTNPIHASLEVCINFSGAHAISTLAYQPLSQLITWTSVTTLTGVDDPISTDDRFNEVLDKLIGLEKSIGRRPTLPPPPRGRQASHVPKGETSYPLPEPTAPMSSKPNL